MTAPYHMTIDRHASTVTIAGRVFPAATAICPPDDDHHTDHDRALGAGGRDYSVYVPAENGVLFRLDAVDPRGLVLNLDALTCQRYEMADGWTWLPWDVGLVDGDLVAGAFVDWRFCEPEWVVETIDRLSRKPFRQPDGPPMLLVRLDHFDACSKDVA